MKAKILHINPHTGQETLVATFTNYGEAEKAAAMLQALVNDTDNTYYYVDFKEKGTNKRRAADTFARIVNYMNEPTRQDIFLHLKPAEL